MTEKTLVLLFVAKAPNEKEDIPYPAELACAVCMAESQRRKASFLRETPEKLAFISKVYYPFWIVPADNSCLMIDGLNSSTHEFTFKEPTKTGIFIEELRKNSTDPQKFMDALQTQAKGTKEFTSPVNLSFAGLIYDEELLSFFPEYFKSGTVQTKDQQEKTSLIPSEIDRKAVVETSQALVNCLRTLQADAKGLQYALGVLKEEVEFHRNASASEIERLKEKLEQEITSLKSVVDKNVKKLTQRHDKAMASVQKSNEKKAAVLERKREKYMHKLQVVEQRKDAAQRRIDAAKKKNSSRSSLGSYALKKYEREVENTKKEVNAVSDAIDKLKKEGNNNIKQEEEEHQNAIAQEEYKLTQLNAAYATKTNEKQKQIDNMTAQAATLTSSLEDQIDELKRDSTKLRKQVEIDWKLDDTDEPVLVQLPIYMIKYMKGEEERYSLLSPITISEDVSVLKGLKKILTLSSEPKLKTLTQPANKKLHETLSSNVAEKIQNDAAYRIKLNEVCRANNLLSLDSFAETLNEGLDEIEKRGWMTTEETSAICRHVVRQET